MRIHLFGASGSGCSSLGLALAEYLDCAFFDTDDFYWEKTDPPFVLRTAAHKRNARLLGALRHHERWVLAGSLSEAWGEEVSAAVSVAIMISVPSEVRMARLVAREKQRYGDRATEGGDMYATSKAFLAWSAGYDTGHLPGRSRAKHEAWYASLACSKLKIENVGSTSMVLRTIIARLEAGSETLADYGRKDVREWGTIATTENKTKGF
jgi:adenylate kinase family enzyme